MNQVEYILIIGGISLDIFATMECQGSVVAKVEKRGLACICLLISFWQAVVLCAGSFLAAYFIQSDGITRNEVMLGNGIAMIILAGLGAHLVLKAIRNERISERREEGFSRSRICRAMTVTGVYTLLAGIAFGLVDTNLIFVLGLLCAFSVLMVIAGTYTGYHFGFEQKTKAYGIGALLLWGAGIDILVRWILSRP